MLRDSVNRFAEKEIAALAAKFDRENFFPDELWRKLGELGPLGNPHRRHSR